MTKPEDERATGTAAAASAAAGAATEEGRWVTTRIDRSRYRSAVAARTHEWVLDEPVGVGGTDTGPTPYETLLGTLGGCTAITLRMYADRKGWPLEAVHVRLRQARAHEADCERCETDAVGPHRLEREIDLEGPLTDEQRRRLLLIADRCPVKQTLERGIKVVEASR
jgi:putative redox protein